MSKQQTDLDFVLFRSDEIELISKQRKPSQAQSLRAQVSKDSGPLETSPDDPGYSSSEYSPMHGTLVVSEERGEEETSVPLLGPEPEDDGDYYNSEEMGSFESESAVMPDNRDYLQTSSYVPPGYMVIEAGAGDRGAEYERFQQFSVSSL